MKCINIKHPLYNRILNKTNNPLGSEILLNRLFDILEDEERYQRYADYLSEDISKIIMIDSPALLREKNNVYKVVLHKDSNKILTLEQAYEVAKARLDAVDKKYGVKGQRSLGRVTDENGPVQLFIEPNKQHVIEYIINDMIQEENDKEGAELASVKKIEVADVSFDDTGRAEPTYSSKKIAVEKAKEFNEVLKNITKNIGVDVKFVDSLVNKHGMTLNGLFKVTKDLKGLIEMSNDSTDDLALSEELSHAIIDGFDKLPVIQNILKLVKSEGYEKFLGDNLEEYRKLYNNNEEMLNKEAAGKALSQALYDNFSKQSESKLTRALKAFWNWIKGKFSKITPSMQKDLDNALDELSMTILGNKLSKATYTKSTSMPSVRIEKGFPMQESNIQKLEDREKTFSVRSIKHNPGYYKFGKNYYNVTLLNEQGSIISDFKNPEYFKKKFIGDEDVKFDHVKEFFNGNKVMYVYQFTKVSNSVQNMLEKEEKRNKSNVRSDKFKDIIVNLKRNIGRLKSKLNNLTPEAEEYIKVKTMINDAESKLNSYKDSSNKAYVSEAINVVLAEINDFINKYENSDELPDAAEFKQIYDFLRSTSLSNLPEVEVSSLMSRFNEIQKRYIESLYFQVTGKEEEYEDIMSNEEDISSLQKSFGTLVNLKDKIATAIGFMIKQAQIKVSSKQGDLYNDIQSHVNKLSKWAKDNNVPTSEMYDLFIQDLGDTTALTRKYNSEFYTKITKYFKEKDWSNLKNFAYKDEETGEWTPYSKSKYENSNYKKIMSNNTLKEFYTFYQKTIKEALDRLPSDKTRYFNENFIPNIMMHTLSDAVQAEGVKGKLKGLFKYTTKINSTTINAKDLLKDEHLERDIIPVKYLAKVTGTKSKDLGESLFKFAAFSIEHEHLSEVLPKTRILQAAIADNKYISSTNSKVIKRGEDTNMYEMVDRFIDMQLRGNKKKDLYKFKYAKEYDEQGNEISHKEVELADVIDFGLTWNSLLRIGLNPITAATNILVGEAGNIIETIGGRFFNSSDLTKASGIFFSQITNKDSKFNHIIEKYPLMQELTDYEYAERLNVKEGLSGEKLKNYMYKMQKSGEIFLQGRTMIAMMLHTKPDGKTSFWDMLDDKGNLKKEYKNQFPDFEDFMTRYSSKVMAVNEKIHGRYSERDAAIIQQNAIWRMAFQFKKWIPAAIEARFEGRRFDERLQEEVEGRWRTLGRMLINLKDTATRFDKGELTELEKYNMRKVATEAALILGTFLMYLGLGWDDDEKKKKDPLYKFTMNQLDRVTGDLLFLANPSNVTALTKNPIAATKLVDDLIGVGANIPYLFQVGEYKYKSGPRKGENKFWSKVSAVTPGAKPTMDIYRLFNDQKYREYNH